MKEVSRAVPHPFDALSATHSVRPTGGIEWVRLFLRALSSPIEYILQPNHRDTPLYT
jgi:hypothetical protein